MNFKSDSERISWAVFLIGLGILFTPLGGILGGFFPGILFVAGAATLARGVTQGQTWYTVSGALWMFGLWIVFLFGFNLPLALILLGAALLFGYRYKPEWFGSKSKNDVFFDEKRKHDEFV